MTGMEVVVKNKHGDLDFLQIAKEEIFKAAIEVRNKWQDNLNKGIGAEGFHGGEWRDTGETINDVTIDPQRPALEISVGGDHIGLAIAEFGRRPNAPMPPHEPIARWAKRKGIRPSDEDMSFVEMVFLIRRKIGEKGIRGFAPARLAWHHVNRDIDEKISQRIDQEVADAGGE